MTIETKFDFGQKVYWIEGQKVLSARVMRVSVNEQGNIYYGVLVDDTDLRFMAESELKGSLDAIYQELSETLSAVKEQMANGL